MIVPVATAVFAGADTAPENNNPTACAQIVTPVAPVKPPTPLPPPPPAPVALPAGVAPEKGMQVKTILAARAVSRTFPEILDIGGVRSDSMKWHPNGLAIDVMIPNYSSPAGRALGDRIVAFVLDNADRFGVNHVLWRQTSYGKNRAPKPMSNRGGTTANHYDHVHIATNGGGFPTGRETYLM